MLELEVFYSAFEMWSTRTFDERIRRLLTQARHADARGEPEMGRNLRALARDLGPTGPE